MSEYTCKTEHCANPVPPEQDVCDHCGMRLTIAKQDAKIKTLTAQVKTLHERWQKAVAAKRCNNQEKE